MHKLMDERVCVQTIRRVQRDRVGSWVIGASLTIFHSTDNDLCLQVQRTNLAQHLLDGRVLGLIHQRAGEAVEVTLLCHLSFGGAERRALVCR